MKFQIYNSRGARVLFSSVQNFKEEKSHLSGEDWTFLKKYFYIQKKFALDFKVNNHPCLKNAEVYTAPV